MKKYIFLVLSTIAVFLTSCDEDSVTGITLDKTAIALSANSTGYLVATIQPENVYGRIKWSSTNETVAIVSDGTVTALSEGTAQIVASVAGYSATCNVTVTAAVTSLQLNRTGLSLKVDSSLTLLASILPVQPEQVVKNLLWTSTNPQVATVSSSGKITAIADGTTSIVASIGSTTAVCTVTVYSKVVNSLTGTNYYLISLDASTAGFLGSANIAADFRANGESNNFYVWNGFNAGTYSGSNFYGNNENWLNLVVTGAGGWSGAAFNIKPGTELNKLKAVTDDASGKYYLHFAIKSSTSNSYAFKMGYGASAVTFVLGTTAMEATAPYGNFARNGQWQEVEIPMSYFKGKGLNYTTGMATTDLFVMLAGGTAGTKLEMDAIFIYKKP